MCFFQKIGITYVHPDYEQMEIFITSLIKNSINYIHFKQWFPAV